MGLEMRNNGVKLFALGILLALTADVSAGIVEVRPLAPSRGREGSLYRPQVAAASDGTFLVVAQGQAQRISPDGVLLDPFPFAIAQSHLRPVITGAGEGWMTFTQHGGTLRTAYVRSADGQLERLTAIRTPLTPIAAAAGGDRALVILSGASGTALVTFDMAGRVVNWQPLTIHQAGYAAIAVWGDEALIVTAGSDPARSIQHDRPTVIEIFKASLGGSVTRSHVVREVVGSSEVEIAIRDERALIAFNDSDTLHARLLDRDLTTRAEQTFYAPSHWRITRNHELAAVSDGFLLSYITIANGAIEPRLVHLDMDGTVVSERPTPGATVIMQASNTRLLTITDDMEAIVTPLDTREPIAPAVRVAEVPQNVETLRTATVGAVALIAWQERSTEGDGSRIVGVRLRQDGAILDEAPLELLARAVPYTVARLGNDFALVWAEETSIYMRRLTTSGTWRDLHPQHVVQGQENASPRQYVQSLVSHWNGSDLALGWAADQSVHALRLDPEGRHIGEHFQHRVEVEDTGPVNLFFADDPERHTFGWGTVDVCRITCYTGPSAIHFVELGEAPQTIVTVPVPAYAPGVHVVAAGDDLLIVAAWGYVQRVTRSGAIVYEISEPSLFGEIAVAALSRPNSVLIATGARDARLAELDPTSGTLSWLTTAPWTDSTEVRFPWPDRVVWLGRGAAAGVWTGRISTSDRADVSIRVAQSSIRGRTRRTSLVLENHGPSIARNIRISIPAWTPPDAPYGPGIECSSGGCDVDELAPGAAIVLEIPDYLHTSGFGSWSATVAAETTDPDPENNSIALPRESTPETRSRGVRPR